MKPINGDTRLIGFFGSTYKTSKMYAMYNNAFEALDLNYRYIPCVVNDLEKAVEGIRHMGFAGIGITVPYKESIIPFLDELEDDAQKVGAVNVVINRDGKLIGGNTDGQGAICALEEQMLLSGKKITLLGAGGAAKAIAYSLSELDCSVTIINRDQKKAQQLAHVTKADYARFEQLSEAVKHADILINATTVGMYPNISECLVDAPLILPSMTVMDIVSNPRETELVKRALARGARVVPAERMLLHQGVIKFKYFTGQEAPIEVMEKTLI